MKTEGTPPPNSTAEEELEAWREVHKKLSLAVLVAKEAVDVAKAQRRFWCEEIHANLTPEGKLLNTSTWKKSVRRGPAKRKPAADKGGSAAKRPRKSQDSSLKIRLKLKAPSPSPSQSSSSEVPILPNSAPTTIAQLFGGDPNSMPPMADAQVPAMSPMQAAQQGGRTTPSSYAPSVRCLLALRVFSVILCIVLILTRLRMSIVYVGALYWKGFTTNNGHGAIFCGTGTGSSSPAGAECTATGSLRKCFAR